MGGVGSSGVGIGYVRPVQFLDHLTVIKKLAGAKKVNKIKSDEFCYTLGMSDHRFLILTESVDLIPY